MPIKSYIEPTPAPKPVPRHVPRDPAVRVQQEERVFDGPSKEEWIRAGYDPAMYPGEHAFMRKTSQVQQAHKAEAEAITGELTPTDLSQDPGEPAHAITGDEHVTVE